MASGDAHAFEQLVGHLYGELRIIARSLLRGQRGDRTLQPTALVNEAYLRLMQGNPRFESRAHFFGAAARAMRQVIVADARQKMAGKRAGDLRRVTFDQLLVRAAEPNMDVLALDEALDRLAKLDPRLCRTVELRFFSGCELEEIAELNGVSLATVKRDWNYSRAWLLDQLGREPAQ